MLSARAKGRTAGKSNQRMGTNEEGRLSQLREEDESLNEQSEVNEKQGGFFAGARGTYGRDYGIGCHSNVRRAAFRPAERRAILVSGRFDAISNNTMDATGDTVATRRIVARKKSAKGKACSA